MGQLDTGSHREVSTPTTVVDHSALKVNQTGIVATVLVAFVGSGGTVEIAVRDGSAARLLGVGVGAEVRA